MAKCKMCGGECKAVNGGYKCLWCGAEFTEADLAARKTTVSEVKTRAADKNSGADLFEKSVNGVLEIRWQDNKSIYSGSGFLISSDGYAITNTHVVTTESGTSCGNVSVKLADENVTAKVVALGDNMHGSGRGVDLALIKLNKIPAGIAVLKFADSDKVRNGEKVYVIGNSLGYGTCITSGIVSDKLRPVNGKNLLMTDCAVNGGNSGGPIFNESGLVIGAVVSGIPSAEGMNFAIPSSQIKEFIHRCNLGIKI